jgi:ankyrin repeat protein
MKIIYLTLCLLPLFLYANDKYCNEVVLEEMVEHAANADNISLKCAEYINNSETKNWISWFFRLGMIELIQSLETHGIDVQSIIDRNANKLYINATVAPMNRIGLLSFLKLKGHNLGDVKTQYNQSIINVALETGYMDSITYIRKEIDNDLVYYESKNLFAVVRSGNINLVKDFLNNIIDPNIEDSDGITPLMVAVELGVNKEIIDELLMRGADCHKKNKFGDSACDLMSIK